MPSVWKTPTSGAPARRRPPRRRRRARAAHAGAFRPSGRGRRAGRSRPGLLPDEIAAEILGDFVVQGAGLHPAHDEQIDGGYEDAVEHAVLRLAEAARPVAHRHLEDAVPAHLEQRRDEAVEATIEDQAAQAFAPERAT